MIKSKTEKSGKEWKEQKSYNCRLISVRFILPIEWFFDGEFDSIYLVFEILEFSKLLFGFFWKMIEST